MSRDPLEGLLGHTGRDPGCEAAFEEFDRYCDAALRGEDVKRGFPEFMNHVRIARRAGRTPRDCSRRSEA